MQRVAELVKQGAGVVVAEAAPGRAGSDLPLEKFITLKTSGRTSPSSFSWSRRLDIQAPLRLDGRAK